MLSTLMASAYDAQVDGVYYNLIAEAKQAEVTWDDTKYTGSVTIPESFTYNGVTYSVTSIGSGAFNGCTGLTSVTIPNSVTSIENFAFQNCSGLTSVTIPNSVTSIGGLAFSGCRSLTSIEIPNSVTSIGSRAFESCHSLTSITIPNSVTRIGSGPFGKCSGLTKVTLNNNAIASKSYSSSSTLGSIFGSQVKEYILGDDVTSIGSYAFYGCSGLTSVTIPNNVTSIGESAFYDCSKLTTINIPNSVTSIGSSTFSGCSGLTSITIGNSVTSIGDSAFDGCSGLTKVTLNSNAIASKSYSYDSTLGSIFGGQVKEYILGDDVTSIGDYAFRNCSGLTSVTIPNSVTSIGSYAFYYCEGLTSVTIPNSVTSIGYQAFYHCSGLTSVRIGNSVTTIGEDAFSYCTGLTSIVVESGNTKYDSRNNCNAIIETASNTLVQGCNNTIIPNSVTSIGSSTFSGCSGLTSIEIPNSVTSIGNYAFYGCSGLTSVKIGSGVENIYNSAFVNCSNLADVYCYAENVPSTSSDAFKGSYVDYATLYVPEASVAAYKASGPWSGFGTIKTLSGETPVIPKCATPTISYENGKLRFSCETEGATCQYSITDTDIKAGSGNEVQLTTTYKVTVYATKDGYENSDEATLEINVSGGASGLRGDVNEDGEVNVGDMVVISNIMSGNE